MRNKNLIMAYCSQQTAGSIILITLSIVFSILFVSCSKEVLSEDDPSVPSGVSQGKLFVRAQSVTSDISLSYPVHIYVFDKSDKCVSLSTIDNSGESFQASLSAGLYTVCAISGASSTAYDLPGESDATPLSVIKLKTGSHHGDILTCSNTVTISSGEENTLTLSLKRKVMQITDVTIHNVPASVTSVSVELAPLYDDICINGTFSSSDGVCTIPLSQSEESGTWISSEPTYQFCASGSATISVKLSFPDGVRSYSYTSSTELEANYRISIDGTYTSDYGIVLNGTLEGEDWIGTRQIVFEFNDDGSSSGTEEPSTPVDKPAVGTLYNGAYVLSSSDNSDGSVTYTLISPNSSTGLDVSQTTDASTLKSILDAAVAELASTQDQPTGWRLPTTEELTSVKNSLGTVTYAMNQLGGVELFDTKLCYFVDTEEGINSYTLSGGFAAERLIDNGTVVRLFKTVVIK